MTVQPLTLSDLKASAQIFAHSLSNTPIPALFGVTDGKAVGTYVEQEFNLYLHDLYSYQRGSAALGIDFPELNVDLKVTSIKQPQSSSPFRSASQKVYGLGYHLLLFVYDKTDDSQNQAAYLRVRHVVFVEQDYTADYQTTVGILNILSRNANEDDIMAFLEERNLPLDDIGRSDLARRILTSPPKLGYLTVSNALQWRLQYSRVISLADIGNTIGVENLFRSDDDNTK